MLYILNANLTAYVTLKSPDTVAARLGRFGIRSNLYTQYACIIIIVYLGRYTNMYILFIFCNFV